MFAAAGHRRNTWECLTRPQIPRRAGEDRLPDARPAWCRRQAAGIGPACEQVIGQLVAGNAPGRLRVVQGSSGLAGRHDPSRLEAACGKALAAGDPSYRAIKGVRGSAEPAATSSRRLRCD
jgi:hypothetical protein